MDADVFTIVIEPMNNNVNLNKTLVCWKYPHEQIKKNKLNPTRKEMILQTWTKRTFFGLNKCIVSPHKANVLGPVQYVLITSHAH